MMLHLGAFGQKVKSDIIKASTIVCFTGGLDCLLGIYLRKKNVIQKKNLMINKRVAKVIVLRTHLGSIYIYVKSH